MVNIIIIAILSIILGTSAAYIYKAKKRGEACIGCPDSKKCNGKCNCH